MLVLILDVCCIAQSPGNAPVLNQPFQDSAVVPAEFQKEIDNFKSRFNADQISTDISKQAGDFANAVLDDSKRTDLMAGIQDQFKDLDIPRVFGSLAIVLGGYFGFVWLTRRFGAKGSSGLPRDVVEVLGQSPFGPGRNLQLVKLGSKLVLLMNSSDGIQSIGEISDPIEVEQMVAKCGSRRGESVSMPIRRQLPVESAPTNASNPKTNLKQILRQLQRVAEDSGGSVFEA